MDKDYFKNLFYLQKFLHNIPPTDLPGDVPEPGGGGGTPPSYVPGYVGYAVKRYTCNVAVTAEIKVMDFVNEVLFPSARMFTSQGADGKFKLCNKKPVTWGLCGEMSEGDLEISVDDVRGWIENQNNFLLIDPYTTESEIHTIESVEYSIAQNSVTLAGSGNLSITGFAGASGSTPATATVIIDDPNDAVSSNLTLDGVEIAFTADGSDTVDGIAGFLAATINAHPKTARRFYATVVNDTVTIAAKFGMITLNEALLNDHAAPVASPVTAPALTATASGNLAAGEYKVARSFVNHRGQTLLSPVATVTIADGEKITIGAVTPPPGCTVNTYIQPQAGSNKIRLHSNNDGSSFVINELPLLTASLPPDFNRTGAEIMRVMASFSDRGEARAGQSQSNVLRASYEWLLGNRTKSINRVDIKYRRAFQDYKLIDLRISDPVNIKKINKTLNVEINGQAIDNDFQAIRIGQSLLAEYRDADFFYTWKSAREAMLLEEGDVVAITDSGSGVVNLPVMIESLSFDLVRAGMPQVGFTGRKYSSSLYDDSIADRTIPTIIES